MGTRRTNLQRESFSSKRKKDFIRDMIFLSTEWYLAGINYRNMHHQHRRLIHLKLDWTREKIRLL